MDTFSREMAAPSLWRRFWPELLLLAGLGLLGLASGLNDHIGEDLMLIGSVNSYVFVCALVIAAIWCVAMFVIFRLWKLATGRVAEALSIMAGGVVVFAAFGVSAIVGVFTLLASDLGPYYRFDVPGASSSYVATIDSFTGADVNIYRGDGRRFHELNIEAPQARGIESFANSHRVDTDVSGRSFLIHLALDGTEVRVPLPVG